jgi:hypothetical protein
MLLLPTALALVSASTLPAEPQPVPSPALRAEPSALAPFFDPAAEEKKPANFSYTFVQLGYYSTDVDVIDESSDAIYGRASLGLFDFLYVFLDYANESIDAVSDDINSDQWGIGIGAHFGVMPKLDLVGEASYLYADLSSNIEDYDGTSNGWMAFAGARWMALPWDGGGLEVNGGFRWIDQETILSDDKTGAWEAGARFHFLKLFSVGATYPFLEDDSRYGFDARVSF